MMKKFTVMLALWGIVGLLHAQDKFTLSGYIKDKSNGEELIGAAVYVKELSTGAITNPYGFYSITLPKGKYTITYTFLGFSDIVKEVSLVADQKISIELVEASQMVEEVVVTGERLNKNVESVEMSVEKMQLKMVRKLPAFMGEVDVIKSVQMLPGIQSGGEGSSGLYVRGGGPDENLLQLDEAPVYNAAHLMGFFSVFNSDVVKDMKVYKGGIPARYGGRASSVLDIRMKEGNTKEWGVTGAVSNLATRLMVEGPIIKDKLSVVLAARRTYMDWVGKAAGVEELKGNQLYFWDINGKVNWIINDKNRIFLSAYGGDDRLGLGESLYIRWGNRTWTARWNHLFSDKLFMNLTALYSKYDYNIGVPGNTAASFDWRAKTRDRSVKIDFTYYLNPNNTIRFGETSIYHHFEPGRIKADDESMFNADALNHLNGLEHALYVSNEQKIGSRLSLNYGLRLTLFQYLGKGTVWDYANGDPTTGDTISFKEYKSGRIIKQFPHLEPRFGAKFTLDDNSSIKASYNRMSQNVHLITNTNSPTPFDLWLPTTKYIKPLIADQVAVGYFRNFLGDQIEVSTEAYYKNMQNVIDYKDGAELFFNDRIETEILTGRGYSYGLELMVKKQTGDFTGWISYTYARTERIIEGVNEGKAYPSSYDRTHDLTLVGTYTLGRFDLSANWVFATGNAFTVAERKYMIHNSWFMEYDQRNKYRMPNYHRLDVSATYRLNKKEDQRYKHSLSLSVYNLYGRRNAYSVSFQTNADDPSKVDATRLSIIGAPIPALAYVFNF